MMMKLKYIIGVFSTLFAVGSGVTQLRAEIKSDLRLGSITNYRIDDVRINNPEQRFKDAKVLYEQGMYERAMAEFENLSTLYNEKYSKTLDNSLYRGYAALCAIRLQIEGSENYMYNYISSYPSSFIVPQLHFYQGLNYFDKEAYGTCLREFSQIEAKQLSADLRAEYVFKTAYSSFMLDDNSASKKGFAQILKLPHSDFTAPAQYALGYIAYSEKDFKRAEKLFKESRKDPRFEEISNYYILECRFMLKDYKFVTKKGAELYDSVPVDRKAHLSRIISESYLVLGDAVKARKYYEKDVKQNENMNRSDYFYAGSVLYAVHDYKGAVDNFNMMTDRTDSLGQIANYNMGYSYIQLKNKVAAMSAFEDASKVNYDLEIQEDAFFNYAKLAFDLNHDVRGFSNYIAKYSNKHKGNQIYNYMALASLYNHDYEGAVNAFDKIDDLEGKMVANYMKANYLRGSQLISSGSYRDAIPCLRAAAYYSDKNNPFNQLSNYWLAESYYRNEKYDDARAVYTKLYNLSALQRRPEGKSLAYDVAYTYFKEGDYQNAAKWFDRYLIGQGQEYRKDAALRRGDCDFIRKDYKNAIPAYMTVINEYNDINDIYPYYQIGLAYDLEGHNSKKIEILKKVEKANVDSPFYSDAMFELGRAYISANRDHDASNCFLHLKQVSRDSSMMAKTLIQLGMIARNASEYENAIKYYREVIEQMPRTGYKDDALLAMEAIYQSKGEPEKYFDYLESIGGAANKTEGEKELMFFSSAEQVFLAENYSKALTALSTFEERYPNSDKKSKADFYIAECYKQLGKKEQACDYYAKVADSGLENSFTELAMLNFSNLSYGMQRFSNAYRGYSSLLSHAKLQNNKYTAIEGMMKSAYYAHEYKDAIACAGKVMQEKHFNKDEIRVAEYIKAKSYLAISQREDAFALFRELSKTPATNEGAEASYLVIMDKYDKGLFDDVEALVYNFADNADGQAYWLAKAFIVLGDSFVERDRLAQAKATFESIESGYEPRKDGADDVLDNVRMRLAKLAELSDAESKSSTESSAETSSTDSSKTDSSKTDSSKKQKENNDGDLQDGIPVEAPTL